MGLIGKHLGNFRVTRLIGRGGMGSVYLGEHPIIGRKVAIKVLHPSMVVNRDIVIRFFNEARAANDIGNPHIIDVIDLGHVEDEGSELVYLVMEFLDGESLGRRHHRKPLGPAEIAHVFDQIASALAASHAKHIIHRDLKPDNVYVLEREDDPLFVKVLDFGIAKLQDQQGGMTRSGMVLGTPEYMSPEQCEGSRQIDGRTDIYALGVMLYELLAGRLPFTGGLREVLLAHLTTMPPPPTAVNPEADPALSAIAMRCLAKNREERYASMNDLRSALRQSGVMWTIGPVTPPPLPAIVAGEAKAAPPEAPRPTPTPTPRPQPAVTPAPSPPALSTATAATVLATAAAPGPAPAPAAAAAAAGGIARPAGAPSHGGTEVLSPDEAAGRIPRIKVALAQVSEQMPGAQAADQAKRPARSTGEVPVTPKARPRRRGLWIGLSSAVLVAVAIAGGVLWMVRGRSQDAAAVAEQRFTAEIGSDPSGARVLRASDRELLGTTPLVLSLGAQAPGLDVVVVLPGYEEERLPLRGGRTQQVFAALRKQHPAPAPAAPPTGAASAPLALAPKPAATAPITPAPAATPIAAPSKDAIAAPRPGIAPASGKAADQAGRRPPKIKRPIAPPPSPPSPVVTARPTPTPVTPAPPAPAPTPDRVRRQSTEPPAREYAYRPIPTIPPSVRAMNRGAELGFVAVLCIGERGDVTSVRVLQGIRGADEAISATLRKWRLGPQPTPLCYPVRLVFAIE